MIADRHLTRSDVTFPELAASNRARLRAFSPTWIVDGLGRYNNELAVTNYPDIGAWLVLRYKRLEEPAEPTFIGFADESHPGRMASSTI